MGFVKMDCPGCGQPIELDESREFGFCSYCGCKVMLDKVIVEHQGNVKIDNSDELKNLYTLARRARKDNDSESAQKYYEQILVKDPNSWEASFYAVYYKTMNCKIAEIQSAAIRISNCEETVLKLIKANIDNAEEQLTAAKEVMTRLNEIASMLSSAAISHYYAIDASIQNNYKQEMIYRCAAARDICYHYGDFVVKIFGDSFGKNVAVSAWKEGIQLHYRFVNFLADKEANRNIIEIYARKIQKYDSSYQAPTINSSSGCYVATCVYGSYDCPEVWTLRRYRDNTLAATWYGRAFIRTYYAVSPTLVKWFGKTNWFKKLWHGKLDRMVKNLNEQGIENTPYQDKPW